MSGKKIEQVVSFKAEGLEFLLNGIIRLRKELAGIGMSSTRNAVANAMGALGGLQAYGPVSSIKELASLIREYKSLVRDMKSVGLLKGQVGLIKDPVKIERDEAARERLQRKIDVAYHLGETGPMPSREFIENQKRQKREDAKRERDEERERRRVAREEEAKRRRAEREYNTKKKKRDSDYRSFRRTELGFGRDTKQGELEYQSLLHGPLYAIKIMDAERGRTLRGFERKNSWYNTNGINESWLNAHGMSIDFNGKLQGANPSMAQQTADWLAGRPSIYSGIDYGGLPNSYLINEFGGATLMSGSDSGFNGKSGGLSDPVDGRLSTMLGQAVERGAERGTEKGASKGGKGKDGDKTDPNWRNKGLRGFLKGGAGSILGSMGSKFIGAYDNTMGPNATMATRAGFAAQAAMWVISKIHKNANEYAKFRTDMMSKGVMGGMSSGAAQDAYYFGEMMGEGKGSGALSHAASMNLILQDMLVGGGGGGLTDAALKYGIDITGTGKGGLATRDEIYSRLAQSVDEGRYDQAELADIFKLLGTDEATALAISSGSEFYNAIQSRSKHASNSAAHEKLDKMIKMFNAAGGEFDASKLNVQAIAAALDLPIEEVLKKTGGMMLDPRNRMGDSGFLEFEGVPSAPTEDFLYEMEEFDNAPLKKIKKAFLGNRIQESGYRRRIDRMRKAYEDSHAAASSTSELTEKGLAAVSESQNVRGNTGTNINGGVTIVVQSSSSTMSGVGRDAADAFANEMFNRSVVKNFASGAC